MNTGLQNSYINMNKSSVYTDLYYKMLISKQHNQLVFSTQQQMRSCFLHQLYMQLMQSVEFRLAAQRKYSSKQMNKEYLKLKKIYKQNVERCDQKMIQIQTEGDMYIQNKLYALTQLLKNKYANQVTKLKSDFKEKEMRYQENQTAFSDKLEQSYQAAIKKNKIDITDKYKQKYRQLSQRYKDRFATLITKNNVIVSEYNAKLNILMQYINKLTKQTELTNSSTCVSESPLHQSENNPPHDSHTVVLRYPR